MCQAGLWHVHPPPPHTHTDVSGCLLEGATQWLHLPTKVSLDEQKLQAGRSAAAAFHTGGSQSLAQCDISPFVLPPSKASAHIRYTRASMSTYTRICDTSLFSGPPPPLRSTEVTGRGAHLNPRDLFCMTSQRRMRCKRRSLVSTSEQVLLPDVIRPRRRER